MTHDAFAQSPRPVSRRGLLAAAAGALAAAPLLAACGTSAAKTNGPGATGADARNAPDG